MTFEFETAWDDLIGKWRVSIFGFDEEPVYLPSVAKVMIGSHPLRQIVVSAVEAAPTAASDEHGLYWPTKTDATKAMKAAKMAPG